MPIVAIDIDGVLADQVPHALSRAKKLMGVEMTKSEITEWNTRVGSVPFDELIAEYLKEPEFVLSMPEMQGAKKAFDNIRKIATVLIASSRPRLTEKETNLWLKSKFDWDGGFVNTTATGKRSLKSNFLVDDYIGNLKAFCQDDPSKVGILLTQPWNVDTSTIRSLINEGRILVAEDWAKVELYIQDYHRKLEKSSLTKTTW